ncbi:MAG: LysR family transcriptional regulator [Verrucomicrobiales bacterium]|nr:LysR family transcriptional regulator [Verrucomicrobiales bacterium]
MELRHLRYFIAVAEAKNFTKASQRLRVAQPALGRQVNDLEEALGVKLLERSPRGASLTVAGEAFLAEARAVLLRLEEAERVVRAFATGERGEVHLGYAPSLTVELLPRILHAYQNEAPGVRVILHDLSTGEMLRELMEGRLQVALMVQLAERLPKSLVFEELCRYPTCVAMPREHRLAAGKWAPLEEVAHERLVVYGVEEYPEYHQMLAELFQSVGKRPTIGESHDSATSLIAAVEARRGVAIVPSSLSCLAGARLKVLPLRPAPPPLVVGMAYRHRELSPACQRLVKLVRSLPTAKAAPRAIG